MHLLVHITDSLKTPILSLVLTELSRPVLTFPLAYRQSNSAYLHIYQCNSILRASLFCYTSQKLLVQWVIMKCEYLLY